MDIGQLNQNGEIMGDSNIKYNVQDLKNDHDVSCQNNGKYIGTSISQETIDNISEQIGQKVMQSVTTHLANLKVNNSIITPEQGQNILFLLNDIYNSVIFDDRSLGNKILLNSLVLSKHNQTMSMFNDLISQFTQIKELIESQKTIIAEQASIIKKQHEAIARFESDVIYKTQKDLIMEIIGIADQLKMTLNDYSTNKDIDLHDTIEQLEEWVNGSLQAVAVRRYINIESKELDPKRQEVIEIQETSNPKEDGLLKSLLPGYVWSVPMVGSPEMSKLEDKPKKYEFMIRPEQMARLKYVKTNDDTSNISKGIAGNNEVSTSVKSEESQSNHEIEKGREFKEASNEEISKEGEKNSWLGIGNWV